jgi:aminomethyltransferase
VLRETPFHPRTAALMDGQAWRRWAGYVVASSYELSHEREYHAIRSAAALFDVTPLYKYLIRGRDAARLLDRIVTRDVSTSKVGQVLYTTWCDARGKVIDDGTVSRLDETTFRLTAADPNFRWLHLNATGLEVVIEDVSVRTAALSVQGPNARAILELACGQQLSALKYFRLTAEKIRGVPVTISRTGYTGDLGYEVWIDAARALPVWDAIVEVGALYGLTPSGMLALDLARNEAGLLLIEVDYISAQHALIDSQTSSCRSAGPWRSRKSASMGATPWWRSGNAARPGVSWGSRWIGTRSSGCMPRSGSPRSCPPRRGGPAFRCTWEDSRSATPQAGAGRRCSSAISRWRTSRGRSRHRGPRWKWR